jgi:hypothetical protein
MAKLAAHQVLEHKTGFKQAFPQISRRWSSQAKKVANTLVFSKTENHNRAKFRPSWLKHFKEVS